MADKEGMERKVWLLPAELSDRIRAYQTDLGIPSEVEAARRLLDSALQMRDTVDDIAQRLKARHAEEKDLRGLARDVLTSHVLVTDIMLGDNDVTFRSRSGHYGRIDNRGGRLCRDSVSPSISGSPADWFRNMPLSGRRAGRA